MVVNELKITIKFAIEFLPVYVPRQGAIIDIHLSILVSQEFFHKKNMKALQSADRAAIYSIYDIDQG